MALRNLKQIYPSIVYICVGYGDEEENIKKLVAELGLQPQVMFFKDISNELKNALVAKSRYFCNAIQLFIKNLLKDLGLLISRLLNMDVPSLGGIDGGATDAIEHEKTGLICDGNELDEVYSSINLMVENNKFYEYGKAAKDNSGKFTSGAQLLKNIKKY